MNVKLISVFSLLRVRVVLLFLQKFIALENSLCTSFVNDARRQLHNLLLVIIKLLSLAVTAEALQAKIDRKSAISLQRSHIDPKFRVEGDAPHR